MSVPCNGEKNNITLPLQNKYQFFLTFKRIVLSAKSFLQNFKGIWIVWFATLLLYSISTSTISCAALVSLVEYTSARRVLFHQRQR